MSWKNDIGTYAEFTKGRAEWFNFLMGWTPYPAIDPFQAPNSLYYLGPHIYGSDKGCITIQGKKPYSAQENRKVTIDLVWPLSPNDVKGAIKYLDNWAWDMGRRGEQKTYVKHNELIEIIKAENYPYPKGYPQFKTFYKNLGSHTKNPKVGAFAQIHRDLQWDTLGGINNFLALLHHAKIIYDLPEIKEIVNFPHSNAWMRDFVKNLRHTAYFYTNVKFSPATSYPTQPSGWVEQRRLLHPFSSLGLPEGSYKVLDGRGIEYYPDKIGKARGDPYMYFSKGKGGAYIKCINLYLSYTGPKWETNGVGEINWDTGALSAHLNPLVGIGRNKDPKMNWYEAIGLSYLQHNPLWYGFLWPKDITLMEYNSGPPPGATDYWDTDKIKSINNWMDYTEGSSPFGTSAEKDARRYLILKAGEDYVQFRCSEKFVPDFQAFAIKKYGLKVIHEDYLKDRTDDGPDIHLQKFEEKFAKSLHNSLRNRRLIDMALTWVLPALFEIFKDDLRGFFVKILSVVNEIPWVNELFSFTKNLLGTFSESMELLTKLLPSTLGKKIDFLRLKIDPTYQQNIFGNASNPLEFIINLLIERGVPWFFNKFFGIDLRTSNMIINILAVPGESQFFDRAEDFLGGIEQKYQLVEKYVEQLMQVVEMFLTLFGQKEAAVQIQKTVSEIWEQFSHFFNQIVETASSFLQETKRQIGQMAGSTTVPAIESALYSGNMHSVIGIIGSLPIQLIDKYSGGAIRAIFRNDVIKYGMALLFAIIDFAMKGFDPQEFLSELHQGLGAFGINFDSMSIKLDDIEGIAGKTLSSSPFTTIIFHELRGAFISMGMADFTLDDLFRYFIELCHMNFFPLEQIFNILWTVTKMVLKVYVGGIFCTVLKRVINGIIQAVLKHFLMQVMQRAFPQIGILNLGDSTITDLSGFTAEKIVGRMTSS